MTYTGREWRPNHSVILVLCGFKSSSSEYFSKIPFKKQPVMKRKIHGISENLP